ncbi:hypothetical protein SPHINGO8AM_110021 [Sphingomonas sp. 8AM]|nr:hypothetical protein SPHINGO8AM_110021 [Sphingomonas sp. 8AM]
MQSAAYPDCRRSTLYRRRGRDPEPGFFVARGIGSGIPDDVRNDEEGMMRPF